MIEVKQYLTSMVSAQQEISGGGSWYRGSQYRRRGILATETISNKVWNYQKQTTEAEIFLKVRMKFHSMKR